MPQTELIYSSEPKVYLNRTVSPLGTKSNWRMQASNVVAPASVVNAASPAAPSLVLARNDSGPLAFIALPLVSMMPVSIPKGVAVDTKSPLAAPGQVKTGLEMLMPGPDILEASIAAVWFGVTVSWQNATGMYSTVNKNSARVLLNLMQIIILGDINFVRNSYYAITLRLRSCKVLPEGQRYCPGNNFFMLG